MPTCCLAGAILAAGVALVPETPPRGGVGRMIVEAARTLSFRRVRLPKLPCAHCGASLRVTIDAAVASEPNQVSARAATRPRRTPEAPGGRSS